MSAITLLFGGRSVEHRASCRSYEHVRERLFEERPEDMTIANVIGITPDGRFRASGPRSHDALPSAIELLSSGRELSAADFVTANAEDSDFVFSLLQGQDGEDGTIQGLARFFDFPDNFGSTLAVSRACDKYAQGMMAYALAESYLKPLATVLVPSAEPAAATAEAIRRFGKQAVVLKPNACGGSFKVLALESLLEEEVSRYAAEIAPFDDHFLIQERIDGIEMVVGMICQAGQWQTMPVFEMCPPVLGRGVQQSWLAPGGEVARRVPDSDRAANVVVQAAQAIARAFRDETYYCFDFLVDRGGSVRFLEVGTHPGLSRSSVFPKLLEAHGMSLLDLVRREFENHAASRAFRRQRIARIAEWVCVNP